MTPTLVKAIHERFPHQVATDLVVWLENAFQAARVLARPPRSVREALGENLVDELMDFIIAVHDRAR
jgi:hypothetical protein